MFSEWERVKQRGEERSQWGEDCRSFDKMFSSDRWKPSFNRTNTQHTPNVYCVCVATRTSSVCLYITAVLWTFTLQQEAAARSRPILLYSSMFLRAMRSRLGEEKLHSVARWQFTCCDFWTVINIVKQSRFGLVWIGLKQYLLYKNTLWVEMINVVQSHNFRKFRDTSEVIYVC